MPSYSKLSKGLKNGIDMKLSYGAKQSHNFDQYLKNR